LNPPNHDQFKKNADLQKQFLNLASDLAQQPDSNSKIVEKVTTTKIPVAPYGKLLFALFSTFSFCTILHFFLPSPVPTATVAGP